mmetsp:Transcript_3175/g.8771  ORF Transcript_3175/g.8771 Transcript_3175/m.8771 type:complete len:120 (-) Transcript_3175:176-535(-)
MNDVFLSLQCALRDSLSVDGDNTYKLSHIGKGKLCREGRLPISIECNPDLIARGLAVLEEAGNPFLCIEDATTDTTNTGSDTTTSSTENAVLATVQGLFYHTNRASWYKFYIFSTQTHS